MLDLQFDEIWSIQDKVLWLLSSVALIQDSVAGWCLLGNTLYSLKCSTMRRTWDAVEILLSSFILHQSYWPKMFLEAFCSSSFIIVILLYCFSCCGISFTCIFLFFAAGLLPESILLYSSLYIFQVPIHPNT